MADLGNLSGLFFSHQLEPDDDMEKAKFASRSEAARYAASIRWKGNVKGDDDGVDTPEKIAKDAKVLRGEYDDFLDKAAKTLSGLAPMTQEQWQSYTGDEDYVDVVIAGKRNTVPSMKLLQLEQRVCALGERARALAKVSVVYDEPMTEEKKTEVRFAREALEKSIIEESGGFLGSITGVAKSKAINLYHQSENFGGSGFYIGLHPQADWTLRSPKDTEGGFMADLDIFFADAKKVPPGVKKAYDALAGFHRSDKMNDAYADREPQPMSEMAIRQTTKKLLEELNKSLFRNSGKWIENLTGKPRAEWNKARTDLGDPEEMVYETKQKNEKKLADEYANVMRGMGIEVGAIPKTAKNGKYELILQQQVSEIFPSRIVKEVQSQMGALNIKKVARAGSYNFFGNTIETDGTKSTNLHEFTHAATYANRVLRSLENVFLERRRMGDPKRTREQYDVSQRITALEGMSSVKGKYGGYYVKDQLSDYYAGRKYGSAKSPTESLTRGVEYLVADIHGSDDDDHKNFAFGALIMAGTEP